MNDQKGGEVPAQGPPQAPAGLTPDDTLDTVGLYCPVPIIKTAERLKGMKAGGILEVVSDDRVILIDMPAWCRSTGNHYLGSSEQSGEHHLFVRKAERVKR